VAYFSAILYREALDRLCVRLNMYLVPHIFPCYSVSKAKKKQSLAAF